MRLFHAVFCAVMLRQHAAVLGVEGGIVADAGGGSCRQWPLLQARLFGGEQRGQHGLGGFSVHGGAAYGSMVMWVAAAAAL